MAVVGPVRKISFKLFFSSSELEMLVAADVSVLSLVGVVKTVLSLAPE